MKRLYLIFILFLFVLQQIGACTTAIISGKHTADGHPLLYKHRDTSHFQNKLMSFSDGKYNYVGIVNSSDKEGLEVWGGYNSAGFAIMNSASYNLNPDEEGKDELEGVLMKKALQSCATLADFEQLLASSPKPMCVSANFGVIDAQGGAAYYETSDYEFKKYNANDTTIAPMGYIIRTNFSFSGDRERDKGLSRYQAALGLFYQESLSNLLSYVFLLQDVSRYLTHGLTGVNLYDKIPQETNKPVYVHFRDFIPRYSTTSVIVVQGVKEKEAPELTTMWTIMGSPLTSVAIPVWLNKQNNYPSILLADKNGTSKLCTWSLELKKQLFPIGRGEGSDYINLTALISADKKGILQKLKPVEDRILENSQTFIEKWRAEGLNSAEIKDFNNWVDQFVAESYNQIFSITTK